MTGDAIFLASGDDFVLLSQQPYETEDVLQRALAEHPEVLAGPTTSGAETGRLLLVKREMGVPGEEGGTSIWSLDHLFLDADAVPVIVEVKRSSDTRIRREVIGQMFDYAANGVKYWPVESLRAAVDESATGKGLTGEELIGSLRPGIDPEEFWRTVESNLISGRIRMVFVADELPGPVIRIIEFLNEQMNPAEVLGVELRQYVGSDHTVYVPRVVGRTSNAVAAKSAPGGKQWTRESFLEVAEERRTPEEVAFCTRLLDDATTRGRLGWGKGATPGVSGWYPVAGEPSVVWNLNLNNEGARAYMYFYLAELVKRVPGALIEQAAITLEQIPAFAPRIQDARDNGWLKYPSVYLDGVVTSGESVAAIFAAIDVLADDVTDGSSTS